MMALTNLTNLTAIHFSGGDAGSFLHSQLSADVLGLAGGQSVFACYCEPRGRVMALLLVYRHEQDYYTIMSRALAASIVKRLKIYVLRSNVIIDALDECCVAGLHTDDEWQPAPASLPAIPVPDSDDRMVITTGIPATATDTRLKDAWKISELQRGISWMCPETSGQFLPQMLGFDTLGAVNFRKGCYPGQEIVARTHYLGKVKRHPRLVCTTAMVCPDPLDKIEISCGDEQYDAVIADCGHSEDGGSCLFTVTRMDPALTVDAMEYLGQVCPVV